jgi:hypothetical protein
MIFISDDGSCKCFDDFRHDRVKPLRACWHLYTAVRICRRAFVQRPPPSQNLASFLLIPVQRHRRHGPLRSVRPSRSPELPHERPRDSVANSSAL